jgi:hypothetical protein
MKLFWGGKAILLQVSSTFRILGKPSRYITIQMKSAFSIKKELLVLTIVLCVVANSQKAEADLYVGNLGNSWTQRGIGDIHGLFPGGEPYGSDTARFTTGAGNFSVNAITLEFEFDLGYPAGKTAPQLVNIQLFQGGSLLSSFGNPVVDSRLTQWPQSSNPSAYTQFID